MSAPVGADAFKPGDKVTIGSATKVWTVRESWRGGGGEEFVSLIAKDGFTRTSMPAMRLRLVTT